MVEVRCKNCNHMLLKAVILVGAIKCKSCGMIFEYEVHQQFHMTDYADPSETKRLLEKQDVV